MLTLTTPTGERHYATVTGLNAETVTLEVAQRPVVLALNDVELFWDGAFVALWRMPDLTATDLKPGDDLKRRVADFQRANGLPSDGVLGEETLLRLAATSSVSRPSLSRSTP
jgi:peptidoglycan hydrolase-like protein with peptidoglycan-binding domain